MAGRGPVKIFLSDPKILNKFLKEHYKPWQAGMLDSLGKRKGEFSEAVGLGECGTKLARDDLARCIRNAWHFLHTGTLLPKSE